MWKTLEDLSDDYFEAGEKLRVKLRDLREQLKTAKTAEERWRIKHLIEEYTPVYTQIRQIRVYLKNYYEPGFYIGDGPMGVRRCRTVYRAGNTESVSKRTDFPNHPERTDTEPARNIDGVSYRGENLRAIRGRAGRKQIDRMSNILEGNGQTSTVCPLHTIAKHIKGGDEND